MSDYAITLLFTATISLTAHVICYLLFRWLDPLSQRRLWACRAQRVVQVFGYATLAGSWVVLLFCSGLIVGELP